MIVDSKIAELNGRDWIRRSLYLYWLQIHEPLYYPLDMATGRIRDYTTRDVYIGNLKADDIRHGGRWFRPQNYREFKEYAEDQLKKFSDLEYPGIYYSTERYRGAEVEVKDFMIDIDFHSQEDQDNLDNVFEGVRFLDSKLKTLGIHILWSLSGGGIHGRLDMLPVINLLDYDPSKKFIKHSSEKYSRLARFLEDYLIKKGFKIKFDTTIYSGRRLFRLIYSPHETMKRIEIPLNLDLDLKTNRISSYPNLVHIDKDMRFLGYIEKPMVFLNLLETVYSINEEEHKIAVKKTIKPYRRLRGGWREYNDIRYDSVLEGYGWIETVIKDKIFFIDGRGTFIWYSLSKAIGIGLIDKNEAVEWVRECIKRYPDSEHPIDYYIKKLDYNMRDDINPPTWRTLLDESGSRIDQIRHLKKNILPVFREAGLVKGDSHD